MTLPSRRSGGKQSHSDQAELRRHNRRSVMEILLNQSTTSRSELGRLTGLSASTVSLIVGELVQEGYLTETGKVESTRGRRPIVLEFKPDAATVIGVDLNELTGSTFDLLSRPCTGFMSLRREGEIGPQDAIQLVERLRDNVPEGLPPPTAIGISVPGTVDPHSGKVLLSANLGWSDVPLARMVSGATGLPVTVEANRICLALSEIWSGTAQGAKNLIYLHVGWRGVGAGVVMNGEIVRGAGQNAGEIGHLQVDPNGLPCHCGKHGCLETVASGRAIAARVMTLRRAAGVEAGSPDSFADFSTAVEEGDEVCREALLRAARHLGNALSAAAALADPELIVIGGSSMQAAEHLLPVIREVIAHRTLQAPTIMVAQDTQEKSAAGAATVASRALLLETNPQTIGAAV